MTRDDGDATQLAALFKNAVVGVVKSRRVEMKNQLHSIPFVTPRRPHARTHARARWHRHHHRAAAVVSVKLNPTSMT